MKQVVTRFKSLAMALKELEPFIRDGANLQSGRPFQQLDDMRSREALANWPLCVVQNFGAGADRFTFTSDPTGGDGIIFDAVAKVSWLTEHVYVPRSQAGEVVDISSAILNAVTRSKAKVGRHTRRARIL
jgi:hypothetical protein